MADPFYGYGSPAGRVVPASLSRTRFAGYLQSEAPSLASPHGSRSTDLQGVGSDYLQKEINLLRTGACGVGDIVGIGVYSEPVIKTVTTGANIKGYPSLEDPDIISEKRITQLRNNPGVLDIDDDKQISKSNYDSLPTSAGESNILFVGGLPKDCTRREVGHLLRPFIRYKDVRVVHKEPRRNGDRAMVLCFVVFIDSKCALTAMEALQGYKFDDKKIESQILKIRFAHFPFRLPNDRGEQPISKPR